MLHIKNEDNNLLTAEFDVTATKRIQLSEKVSATEVKQILFNQDTSFLGLLPPAVRWVSQDGKLLIAERPPQYRDVNYTSALKMHAKQGVKYKFNIAVPWTIYIMLWQPGGYIDLLFAFANDKPIESLDDVLWNLPVPNIYQSGSVCKPNSSSIKLENAGQAINEAYQLLWNSNFNLDIQNPIRNWINISKNADPQMSSLYDAMNRDIAYGFERVMHFLSELELEDIMNKDKFFVPKLLNKEYFKQVIDQKVSINDIYWDSLVHIPNNAWFGYSIEEKGQWFIRNSEFKYLRIRDLVSCLGYNPKDGKSLLDLNAQASKAVHNLLVRFS